MKLKVSIALLLALAPSLAFARPKASTGHMRPQLFRDRAPKAHVHEARPHETRTPAPK